MRLYYMYSLSILIILILGILFSLHQRKRYTPIEPTNYVAITPRTIIGYIHICQTGEWKRSLTMLLHSIKKYGLYESTSEIRIGIVNDAGILQEDPILDDFKFKIVYVGKSAEYERATLHHMRKSAETDDENTVYYYLHTKGLKHFGKSTEKQVIDWIQLMLYWNIENWRHAIEKLKTYDTYGCNDLGIHYSGNFWWARRNHILHLPTTIESYYTAPEDWIQIKRDNKYSAFDSGYQGAGHYIVTYPRKLYDSPDLLR